MALDWNYSVDSINKFYCLGHFSYVALTIHHTPRYNATSTLGCVEKIGVYGILCRRKHFMHKIIILFALTVMPFQKSCSRVRIIFIECSKMEWERFHFDTDKWLLSIFCLMHLAKKHRYLAYVKIVYNFCFPSKCLLSLIYTQSGL